MRIAQMFQSINGEVSSSGQGSICTFIRLQGCLLHCKWCDTPLSLDPKGGTEIAVEYIIKQMNRLSGVTTPNVTITGGEPLLQMEELSKLIEELVIQGYKVSVETNGSLPWSPISHLCSIVMDIKPPSSGIKNFDSYRETALINASHLRRNDWLKFPIQDETDFLFAVSERRILLGLGKMQAKIAFSAVAPLTPKELLSWLFKENIGDAVLNVQIHKLIDVS